MDPRKGRAKRSNKLLGQATTEYVLLLGVIAGIILSIGIPFTRKMQKLISNSVSKRIQNQYLAKGGVHKFWMPK